jgi:AcrR family transcriptional regulator
MPRKSKAIPARSRTARPAAPPVPGGSSHGASATAPAAAIPPDHATRTRILHTAFTLFHEQGYHATGISTILREAGINAGSLYHFFPSKESLLIGVLEFALVFLRPAVMDPAEKRTEDPIGRIFGLLQQYREGMEAKGCKMGCPVGNLALEVADDNAPARRLIHQNFENWALAVKKWLDDAGNRLPSDIDRVQLARFILTVMEGGLMQARAAGNLGPFDDSVAQLRAYFDALERLAAAEKGKSPSLASAATPARKRGARLRET